MPSLFKQIEEKRLQRADLLDKNRAILEEAEKNGKLTNAQQAEFDSNYDRGRILAGEQRALQEQKSIEEQDVAGATSMSCIGPGGPATADDKRWLDQHGNEIRAFAGREDSVGAYARRDGDEFKGLGIGQFLRALATGPRNELERRALSGSLGAGGAVLAPTMLSADIIDLMRRQSAVFGAGATLLTLTSDNLTIAKLASDPALGWHGEGRDVDESEPTFAALSFYPKTMACIVKAPMDLLEDAPNVAAILEKSLGLASALEVDRVSLFGGVDGNNLEPSGMVLQDLNDVDQGTNGAALGTGASAYGELLEATRLILDDNGEMPTTAIMAPREWETIAGLKDSTHQPLRRPKELDGLTFVPNTVVPVDESHGTATDASRIILGGFANLAIGMRINAQVEVLKERYAEKLQVGFLIRTRMDVGVLQPNAFAQIRGIIPA